MNMNTRVPLYQKIQQYILEQIRTNGLQPGERIPTEKELMEQFNVSKITVVKALSGLADEHIIDRVPGKGSFVGMQKQAEQVEMTIPAAMQKSEPSALISTKLIGLIIPSILDYFAIRLINGVQTTLGKHGYRMMILMSEGDIEKEKEALKTLQAIGAEGILIFPVDEEHYNEEILNMKFSGYPFVLIDRFLPGVETDYIAADGRLGAQLAVDYLWELGHRQIAICSDSPIQTLTVQERIEGYITALKNKGAMINPAHIITDFYIENLKDAESHPLFRYMRNRMATAYITLNGRLGVQMYQLASQAGLKVPDDLSIISFDEPTSVVDDFSIFTYVKQFEYEIGCKAAETILDVIRSGRHEQGRSYSKILLKPELVPGHTTGKPPEEV
ncbi:substrate-binding domain-containing protein [Paenibacillus sp. KQZ6P-2]|uniref:Substrate-binding domain-containing protein n=1 Tax=Paenibacillus mangrovi TaxID=2931978 RepID=A0A9X2B5E9_9BACL|nr:substrate-binding domain-containing protein [Paenibacillus mangrovi]MCJ8014955.1 substrate-binding domain-containing protein [Paenibacillus mangrovi]